MLNLQKRGLQTWNRERMPVAEFRERVEVLKKAMKRENLDALLVGASLNKAGPFCYVSNLQAWLGEVGFLMLSTKGDPIIVSASPGRDVAWEKELTWVPMRTAVGDSFSKDYAPTVKEILDEWGLKEGRLGTVAIESNMSLSAYGRIKKMLDENFPRLELEDAGDLVEKITMIKREREIAAVKRAAGLADLAYETLLKSAKAGKKEFEVAADIDKAQRVAGAADNLVWMATGPQAEVALGGVEDRELRIGDMFLFKIAVLAESYWAEIGRTFVLGEPTSAQSDLLNAAREVEKRMIEAVRPGTTASRMAKTALKAADELGYGAYLKSEYGFGHGIGLDFEEKPAMTEENTTELKPGMTITASVGMHKPSVGGAFLGDTLMVTASGCERLLESNYEKTAG